MLADNPSADVEVNGTDGKYSKMSDTLWANCDGTKVIVNLGYRGMEGCSATRGIADVDCYPEL